MNSLAALAVALVVGGCGRTVLDDPVSALDTETPTLHRASHVCPATDLSGTRPHDCRLSGPSPMPGACSEDSDCPAGAVGRCVLSTGSTCGCVYDACQSDGDCPAGQACACNELEIGNTCVPAPCAVDGDCGTGGFCGPVVKPCVSTATVAYQCYSSRDECVSDSDCSMNEECVALPGEAWACHAPGACR